MTDLLFTPQATVEFSNDSGDVAFSPASVVDGAGRQSAQHDLGSGQREYWYEWRSYCQCQATPTLYYPIRIYLKTSNSSTLHLDNDDGTGDIAVSAEAKLVNLTPIGAMIVDEAAANIEFVAKGEIYLPHRFLHVVWWNDSGATLTADATENKFELTPLRKTTA